jgi:hypothetical protein
MISDLRMLRKVLAPSLPLQADAHAISHIPSDALTSATRSSVWASLLRLASAKPAAALEAECLNGGIHLVAFSQSRFQFLVVLPPEGVKLLGRWTRTDFSGGVDLLSDGCFGLTPSVWQIVNPQATTMANR